MDWISHMVDSVLRHINRTFHKTTCANEYCSNRCECTNGGESSGKEVSVPTQHEPESKIIFTTRLEVRRISQSSATPLPPPNH